MSTRCVITVIDNDERYAVYRHSDGDPSSVLPDLEGALPLAWALPRFEACEFAAAVVAAFKEGGGGIYLSTGADHHGDLEYHYEIRQHLTVRTLLVVTVLTPVRDDAWDVIGWRPWADTDGLAGAGGTYYLPALGALGKLAVEAIAHDTKPARRAGKKVRA